MSIDRTALMFLDIFGCLLRKYIEPKGEHLRRTDEWKMFFQMRIHDEAILNFQTANDKFEIWGMPFYTQRMEQEFADAMTQNFLKALNTLSI